MAAKQVIVIGAGITGLSAALRLCEEGGYDVTILEKEPWVGGQARSFERGGCFFDLGSHRLHANETSPTSNAMRSCSATPLLLRERRGKLILRERLIDYPPSIWQLSSALGPRLTARCFLDMVAARTLNGHPAKPESFESFLMSRAGKTAYKTFYEPYAAKLYNTPPSQISSYAAKKRVTATRPGAIVREFVSQVINPTSRRKSYLYPRKGIGQIPEGIASRIRDLDGKIICGAEVTEIGLENSRPAKVVYRRDGETLDIPSDAIISTMQLTNAVKALGETCKSDAASASVRLRWRSLVMLYLIIDKNMISRSETHYLPETKYPFGRLSEPKRYDPLSAPPGRTALCFEITCNQGDDVWNMEAEALSKWCVPMLEKLGFHFANVISDTFVERRTHVYPIYDLGWEGHLNTALSRLSDVEGFLTTGRQGLFLHMNMDQAAHIGRDAAEVIIRNQSNKDFHEIYYRNYMDLRFPD